MLSCFAVCIEVNVDVVSFYAAADILGNVFLTIDQKTASHRDHTFVNRYRKVCCCKGAGAGLTSPALRTLVARAVSGCFEGAERNQTAVCESVHTVCIAQSLCEGYIAGSEVHCVNSFRKRGPVNVNMESVVSGSESNVE